MEHNICLQSPARAPMPKARMLDSEREACRHVEWNGFPNLFCALESRLEKETLRCVSKKMLTFDPLSCAQVVRTKKFPDHNMKRTLKPAE